MQFFIKEIGQMDGLIEEFDPRVFGILADHMTVYTDRKIAGCNGTVTLLYGAKDGEHSNAAVLKEWLEENWLYAQL